MDVGLMMSVVTGPMMRVGKSEESSELAGLGTSYTRHLHIFCVSNRPPFQPSLQLPCVRGEKGSLGKQSNLQGQNRLHQKP